MKKLALKFQKGNFWSKLLWITLITLILIALWYVVSSVMFFLQVTVGTIGLLIASPFVAMGIIAIAIIKYPRVRDRDSYSDYVKKYL